MTLTHLTLTHFRNYEKRTFQLKDPTTLVIGQNTAGKTNMLEAVMMLAVGKSFRADSEREVISWGSGAALVHGRLSDTSLEVRITPETKRYLVNGVAKRQIDFVGHLRAVFFWPEHMELVTDSPSLRRRYLDSVLVQTDREYRRNLVSYERGLRQRNKLLDLINEGKAHRYQLLFWNQLLIKSGGYLTDARESFITFVNRYKIPHMAYQIMYDKSVISESRLTQYADEEVAAKATLVGPHRDDFNTVIGTRDLGKFGSRGEQRLAILWLKMTELSYIESVTKERPMLLLDDIFSELDERHRAQVLSLLGKQQTIITSAEESVRALLGAHHVKVDTIQL